MPTLKTIASEVDLISVLVSVKHLRKINGDSADAGIRSKKLLEEPSEFSSILVGWGRNYQLVGQDPALGLEWSG